MGTISVNKLAGYSMMVGPILALVCYFIQPGGILIDPQNPTDPVAVVTALQGNAALSAITGILIPVGLLVLLSGIMYFVQRMDGGEGFAIARLGLPMVFVAVAGWVISSAMAIGIAGADASAMQIATTMSVASFSINTLMAIVFGVGIFLIALGASVRDENNTILAYVAGIFGLLCAITGIISGIDSSQAELMNQLSGICFVVVTIWTIIMGRQVAASE